VPAPGAPIDDPVGDGTVEPIGELAIGWVVDDADGVGVLDPPPQAVGWLGVSDPLDGASLEPDVPQPVSAPDVTTFGWAPPARSEPAGAELAEGGATVRSLWQ